MKTFADILSEFLRIKGDTYHVMYCRTDDMEYYDTDNKELEEAYGGAYRWGFDLRDGVISVYIYQMKRHKTKIKKRVTYGYLDNEVTYGLHEPISSLAKLLSPEILIDIVTELAWVNTNSVMDKMSICEE